MVIPQTIQLRVVDRRRLSSIVYAFDTAPRNSIGCPRKNAFSKEHA